MSMFVLNRPHARWLRKLFIGYPWRGLFNV